MYLFPTIVLTETLAFIDPARSQDNPTIWGHGASLSHATLGAPLVLFMAWPYLLTASVAWAVLHRLRLASPTVAALIGAAEGVACVQWGPRADIISAMTPVVVYAVFLVVGALTGLVVWQVAYGTFGKPSQDRAAAVS